MEIDIDDPSIFELADVVQSLLALPVDFVAFMNRASYQIVLDLCVNEATGWAEPIPVFEPMFDVQPDGYTFKGPKIDNESLGIPFLDCPQLSSALHDLAQAIRYSHRTPTYCRLAIETVRNYFDPQSKALTWRERYRQGELAMCQALKLDRHTMRQHESYAARSRHGEQLVDINWEKRKAMLEFSWEVVNRFRLYLASNSTDDWAVA